MDLSGNQTNQFYSQLEPYIDNGNGEVSPSAAYASGAALLIAMPCVVMCLCVPVMCDDPFVACAQDSRLLHPAAFATEKHGQSPTHSLYNC